ncbi:VQ motif-containing protein [Euphorbia peplus]|nr:VQ motif-containing protein [Euphorbia peplus]
MSPSPSQQDQNPKINNKNVCPTHLKINKDSHAINKKSSSSSSPILSSSPPSAFSSSSSAVKPPPQRTPVIIYTHSPKIIHTNPTDFMALVQKLTGMSRSDDDPAPDHHVKRETGSPEEENNKNVVKMCGSDDNESSSVITTDENCGDHGQVNSCFVPPIFEPTNPYLATNIPVFTTNHPVDFLCGNHHQSYFNYTDSLYFNNPNLRTSISSSSSSPMERMKDFPEY